MDVIIPTLVPWLLSLAGAMKFLATVAENNVETGQRSWLSYSTTSPKKTVLNCGAVWPSGHLATSGDFWLPWLGVLLASGGQRHWWRPCSAQDCPATVNNHLAPGVSTAAVEKLRGILWSSEKKLKHLGKSQIITIVHKTQHYTTRKMADAMPLPFCLPLICYNLIPGAEKQKQPPFHRSVFSGFLLLKSSEVFSQSGPAPISKPQTGSRFFLLSTKEFFSVTLISLPTSKGECQAQRSHRLND